MEREQDITPVSAGELSHARPSHLRTLLTAEGVILGLVYLSTWSFGGAIKKQVREQQNGDCADCGQHVRKLEIHHRVPESMGGSDTIENAVGLCGPKNGDCHEYWDQKALTEGVIYPGIDIQDAPRTLFKHKNHR